MFAAVGAIKSDRLLSSSFLNAADYKERLSAEMNDTSEETIEQIQEYLQAVKDNAYSFETDSAKADMITGKVVAGYQWSAMPCIRWIRQKKMIFIWIFAVPRESTNLYFDGWCMLKNGIKDSEEKKRRQKGLQFPFKA